MAKGRRPRPETAALHAGAPEHVLGGPIAPPLIASTSFYAEHGTAGFSAAELGEDAPYFYSRWANPTLSALEARWAALEGADHAAVFASGMAAVSALFFHELKSGDHLVLTEVCYAGVAELARSLRDRYGIGLTPVDAADPDAVRRAITPQTKLVHVETPANPLWTLVDVAAVAEVAHAAGARLSVDATGATPIGLRPLEHGADYVVHSLTKYAAGHGDALGGVIASNAPLHHLRQDAMAHLGGVMNPFAAWLILRGLETLPIRMARHQENARAVAQWLEAHPRVKRVLWMGLPSHPQHNLAGRQMDNFTGLLSFVPDDGPAIAAAAKGRLEAFSYAVSLGKTKSLIYYVPTDKLLETSFAWGEDAAARYRAQAGDGVFRVSVGLEAPDDLIADLERLLT